MIWHPFGVLSALPDEKALDLTQIQMLMKGFQLMRPLCLGPLMTELVGEHVPLNDDLVQPEAS